MRLVVMTRWRLSRDRQGEHALGKQRDQAHQSLLLMKSLKEIQQDVIKKDRESSTQLVKAD